MPSPETATETRPVEIITTVPEADPDAVLDTGPQFVLPEQPFVPTDGAGVDDIKINRLTVVDHTGEKPTEVITFAPGGPIDSRSEKYEAPKALLASHQSLARRALSKFFGSRPH